MVIFNKKIERQSINTSLKVDIMDRLKEVSEKHGIPVDRLIEASLEKYLKQTWITSDQNK